MHREPGISRALHGTHTGIMIEYSIQQDQKTTLEVGLQGKLDIYNISSFKKQLPAMLDSLGQRDLVLILDDLIYLDSSGLGLLVHIKKETEQRGSRLVFKGIRDDVRQVIRLCGMEMFFDFE